MKTPVQSQHKKAISTGSVNFHSLVKSRPSCYAGSAGFFHPQPLVSLVFHSLVNERPGQPSGWRGLFSRCKNTGRFPTASLAAHWAQGKAAGFIQLIQTFAFIYPFTFGLIFGTTKQQEALALSRQKNNSPFLFYNH